MDSTANTIPISSCEAERDFFQMNITMTKGVDKKFFRVGGNTKTRPKNSTISLLY